MSNLLLHQGKIIYTKQQQQDEHVTKDLLS